MKPLVMLTALIAMFTPAVAFCQSVQTYIIDAKPSGKQAGRAEISQVKGIGFLTSKTTPNVVLGMGRGLYLYTSPSGELAGPWVKSTIDTIGHFYEQFATFTKPGDTYPGIVTSRSRKMDGPYQLVWYSNPMNQGNDPGKSWPMEIINPDAGCHDFRIGDIDQDGLVDVVCSSTYYGKTLSFIAFQNASGPWTIVDLPFRLRDSVAQIGESIDLISISGGPRINVVGANDGGVYWFRNPKLTGGDPRTDPWHGYRVGDANRGVSIATDVFNRSGESILVASNEELPASWTPGLVWYEPPPNPTQAWVSHSVDSTYRNVHNINTGHLDGLTYFVLGEQEQACAPFVAAAHPRISCRVTMFTFKEGAFVPFSISGQGTHNQKAINYKGGILVVGANHRLFGTPHRALQAWFISASSQQPAD